MSTNIRSFLIRSCPVACLVACNTAMFTAFCLLPMFGWVVQYLVYDAKFFCINWRHELVPLHARFCKPKIKTNQS